MFDSVTAAEDSMKSKLPGAHKRDLERSLKKEVFDSVTAAEDNMKSKLPGAHKREKETSRGHIKGV